MHKMMTSRAKYQLLFFSEFDCWKVPEGREYIDGGDRFYY
jgi:hypothetical protein